MRGSWRRRSRWTIRASDGAADFSSITFRSVSARWFRGSTSGLCSEVDRREPALAGAPSTSRMADRARCTTPSPDRSSARDSAANREWPRRAELVRPRGLDCCGASAPLAYAARPAIYCVRPAESAPLGRCPERIEYRRANGRSRGGRGWLLVRPHLSSATKLQHGVRALARISDTRPAHPVRSHCRSHPDDDGRTARADTADHAAARPVSHHR